MCLSASGWFEGWKQLGCAIQVTYQRLYFEWFDFTVFYTNTGNTWICIANVLVSPLHVTSAESSIGNPLCAWAGTRQLCPSISYRVWDNSVVQIMQHSSAFHYHPLFIDARKTFPRNPDSGPTLLAIEGNIDLRGHIILIWPRFWPYFDAHAPLCQILSIENTGPFLCVLFSSVWHMKEFPGFCCYVKALMGLNQYL